MPRYLVERTFRDGLEIPGNAQGGATLCASVVGRNGDAGVTWVHSYVSDDRRKTFCIYDAPSPEAVRRAAELSKLPIDRITRVMVLDPYFFR